LAFFVCFHILLGFLKNSFTDNIWGVWRERILPSILLASSHQNGNGLNEESDFTDEMNEGLSDKSEDSESTKEAKSELRNEMKEYGKIKDRREEINNEHARAGDDSDSEAEEALGEKLEKIDQLKDNKKGIIHWLKDKLIMKDRSRRDGDDDNRRDGPSAGTTGGPSEGGPSEGGSEE
jgi:hypothetical protein